MAITDCQHCCYFQGHSVAQVRLLFCIPIPKGADARRGLDSFFAYVERFDIVPQATSIKSKIRSLKPNPVTTMYVLKRATRADNSQFGDIVPVSQFRGPVDLIPRFGAKADTRLTRYNSMHYSREYWLNKYHDKEIYWSLSLEH